MIENKILKWSLVLGIVVVLNLFFAYALKVVYKAPEYTNFCQEKQVIEKIDTQEACLDQGGQWDQNMVRMPAQYEKGAMVSPEQTGYCNLNFECNEAFRAAQEKYEKNVFIALVVLGVLSIVVSFFIAGIEVVSMGLSLGGVLSFVVASIRYWQYASEYLQVVILGLALVVLIWLGVKKFK